MCEEYPSISKNVHLSRSSIELFWSKFFFQMKGPTLFQGEKITLYSKNTLTNFKNFPLQNHWANLNQTWHKASLGEGDSSLFLKKVLRPYPRGDNYEITKYIDKFLKTSSPEPLSQFQPHLAQNILGWRGFKFINMKVPAFFQGD